MLFQFLQRGPLHWHSFHLQSIYKFTIPFSFCCCHSVRAAHTTFTQQLWKNSTCWKLFRPLFQPFEYSSVRCSIALAMNSNRLRMLYLPPTNIQYIIGTLHFISGCFVYESPNNVSLVWSSTMIGRYFVVSLFSPPNNVRVANEFCGAHCQLLQAAESRVSLTAFPTELIPLQQTLCTLNAHLATIVDFRT